MERTELADSLSQAFLVVLERMTPLERAAFLLREVFDYDYDYDRLADILDREEANCRQVVARARRHLRDHRPRFDDDPAKRVDLLQRFQAASGLGDLRALESMLADDAVLYWDGGGKAFAVAEPVLGSEAVAAFMTDITRKRHAIGRFTQQLVHVNGQPGRILLRADGAVWDVLSADVVGDRIAAIRIVRNPDKLAHL